jgi:Rieske Fe-S protein
MRTRYALYVIVANIFSFASQAGTITVETETLEPGTCSIFVWRSDAMKSYPIAVCKRTPEQVLAIKSSPNAEYDPMLLRSISLFAFQSTDSHLASQILAMQTALQFKRSRSLRDDIFVATSVDPYLGCRLTPHYESQTAAFVNPCQENIFDSNGRVTKTAAPSVETFSLRIPPHHYLGETLILGETDPDKILPIYDFRPAYEAASSYTKAERLSYASHWGEIDEMKALLNDGVDPNGDDDESAKFFVPPLLIAVAGGKFNAVELLLDSGADPNATSGTGLTALRIAEASENSAIITLLKEHGAKDLRKR